MPAGVFFFGQHVSFAYMWIHLGFHYRTPYKLLVSLSIANREWSKFYHTDDRPRIDSVPKDVSFPIRNLLRWVELPDMSL